MNNDDVAAAGAGAAAGPRGTCAAAVITRDLVRFPVDGTVLELDLVVASPEAWARSGERARGDFQVARDDPWVVAYRMTR